MASMAFLVSWVVGMFLVLLLLLSVVTQATNVNVPACSQPHEESPYVIIIDGGSTGSRLHIFEFVHDDNNNNHNVQVQRRGSTRVDRPLSAWGPTHDQPWVDPDDVARHLYPLWAYAAPRIPRDCHRTTPIHYAATAGMRLLTESAQEQVYRAAVEGLLRLGNSSSGSSSESNFQFSRDRLHFATLSGELEGYYGAVAANYLHKNINSTATTSNSSSSNNKNMILGALDMGGASAQVVYPHTSSWSESMDEQTCGVPEIDDNNIDNIDNNNNSCSAMDDFFSVSYLSYGVDQFRERLWNLLVWEHMQQQQHVKDSATNEDASCDAGYVENPCLNPGFTVPWEHGYTLLGTGDAVACQQQVRRLLPHPHAVVDPDEDDNHDNRKRVVGGIEHPPIPPGQRFVAQSLYFFTLDSLRQFSGNAVLDTTWPTPTLTELDAALPQLCQRDWDTDLQHADPHRFTSPTALPHRCFESVYLLQLLQHGLGLDPHARDVLFAYELNDSEVEWTLGMALSMQRRRNTKSSSSSRSSNGSDKNNHVPKVEKESTLPAGIAESKNKDSTTTTETKLESPAATTSTTTTAAAAAAPDALSDFATNNNETKTPPTALTTIRARWIQLVAEVLVSDNVEFVSTSGSYATLR